MHEEEPKTLKIFLETTSASIEQMNLSFNHRDNENFNKAYIEAKVAILGAQLIVKEGIKESEINPPKPDPIVSENPPQQYSDKTISIIAKLTHEVNKKFCESIGDTSQPEWEDAPEWQKSSAMGGVRAILNGTVVNPEDSHKSWMELKEKEGWVYGPVKDPEKKEHPCMVPFDELPPDQQYKDILFLHTVLTQAVSMGLKRRTSNMIDRIESLVDAMNSLNGPAEKDLPEDVEVTKPATQASDNYISGTDPVE